LASGKEKFHPYDDSSHVAVLSKSADHENIAFKAEFLPVCHLYWTINSDIIALGERDSTLFEKHYMGFFI